jgi:hypothetical protein
MTPYTINFSEVKQNLHIRIFGVQAGSCVTPLNRSSIRFDSGKGCGNIISSSANFLFPTVSRRAGAVAPYIYFVGPGGLAGPKSGPPGGRALQIC